MQQQTPGTPLWHIDSVETITRVLEVDVAPGLKQATGSRTPMSMLLTASTRSRPFAQNAWARNLPRDLGFGGG